MTLLLPALAWFALVMHPDPRVSAAAWAITITNLTIGGLACLSSIRKTRRG